MKTIIIYDQAGEDKIQFFVLEGDQSKFDDVYINSELSDPDLQEELTNIIYDEGRIKVDMINEFPSDLYNKEEGDVVIVAGFLP